MSLRRYSSARCLLGLVLVASSCTLLAPSDEELLGGANDGLAGAAQAGESSAGARAGEAGSGGGGAVGGEGGRSHDSGGEAGMGGHSAGPCEQLSCHPDADCRVVSGEASCVCGAAFDGDGLDCYRFPDCRGLHEAQPDLPSGSYWIRPSGAAEDLQVYCEMAAEDGGWTLILNEGLSFDPLGEGAPGDVCYDTSCTSLAYAAVPAGRDVMLDVSDSDIGEELFDARIVISGIDPAASGRTLRQLFNTGPYFLDADDNSNVKVLPQAGVSCSAALAYELGNILCAQCASMTDCGVPVLVFGDHDSVCPGLEDVRFPIGAATSRSKSWGQCAGWPQQANYNDFNFLPDNFRIWFR